MSLLHIINFIWCSRFATGVILVGLHFMLGNTFTKITVKYVFIRLERLFYELERRCVMLAELHLFSPLRSWYVNRCILRTPNLMINWKLLGPDTIINFSSSDYLLCSRFAVYSYNLVQFAYIWKLFSENFTYANLSWSNSSVTLHNTFLSFSLLTYRASICIKVGPLIHILSGYLVLNPWIDMQQCNRIEQ
jgi:hypothetical protein